MQKNETGSLYYTIPKINSKWIKDLNVRLETIKQEEIVSGKLLNLGLGNDFLSSTLKENETKTKINKWD